MVTFRTSCCLGDFSGVRLNNATLAAVGPTRPSGKRGDMRVETGGHAPRPSRRLDDLRFRRAKGLRGRCASPAHNIAIPQRLTRGAAAASCACPQRRAARPDRDPQASEGIPKRRRAAVPQDRCGSSTTCDAGEGATEMSRRPDTASAKHPQVRCVGGPCGGWPGGATVAIVVDESRALDLARSNRRPSFRYPARMCRRPETARPELLSECVRLQCSRSALRASMLPTCIRAPASAHHFHATAALATSGQFVSNSLRFWSSSSRSWLKSAAGA